MPGWRLLRFDCQQRITHYSSFENRGTVERPSSNSLQANGPESIKRTRTMAENRRLSTFRTWEKRCRFDDFRIKVIALRKKSREIFLVGDNFSEARRQHWHFAGTL